MRRLVLPFKWEIGRKKVAHISHVETSSSFYMDIFPKYRTPRAFVHLDFMARHGRAIRSSRESIRQHLLNLSRRWHPGNVDPFPARGGYLVPGS